MARRAAVTYYSDVSGLEITEEGAAFSSVSMATRSRWTYRLRSKKLRGRHSRRSSLPPEQRLSQAPSACAKKIKCSLRKDRRPHPQNLGALECFDVPARARVPELVREAYQAANAQHDAHGVRRLSSPGSLPR